MALLTKPSISVILLAGGTGSRIASIIPKQFMPLQGKPIAHYSLEVFLSVKEIHEVVIVTDTKYLSYFDSFIKKAPIPIKFALPGKRRQDSVFNGLQEVNKEHSLVCIHDAARPFIQISDVKNLLESGQEHNAATLAVPLKFTVKEVSSCNRVIKTPDRSSLYEIQTPQIISKNILEAGFAHALANDITVTDDVSLAELLKYQTKIVLGKYSNIKITTEEDLFLAPHLLQQMQNSSHV